MRYTNRIFLTVIGVVAVTLILMALFEYRVAEAVLVATPGCLMIGSLFTLLHLAVNSEKIDAKSQLTTLLIVEFFLVPLGAAAALVAFFWLRSPNPPDADPNWNSPPSVSSTLP